MFANNIWIEFWIALNFHFLCQISSISFLWTSDLMEKSFGNMWQKLMKTFFCSDCKLNCDLTIFFVNCLLSFFLISSKKCHKFQTLIKKIHLLLRLFPNKLLLRKIVSKIYWLDYHLMRYWLKKDCFPQNSHKFIFKLCFTQNSRHDLRRGKIFQPYFRRK